MRRFVTIAFVLSLLACDKKDADTTTTDAQPPLTLSSASSTSSMPSGIASAPSPSTSSSSGSASDVMSGGPVVDLVVGTGAEATSGKKITVHYTLWLAPNAEGQMRRIESSHDKNKPYSFRLGAGGVVKGWDEGIPGMRVGGKRRLVVPPQLGYGAAGSPPSIPGNATLVFEIELLDVK